MKRKPNIDIMKIYLKFDHEQKDCLKAIGCDYDGEQISKRALRVIEKHLNDDRASKVSHLSELIHEELDYEEILFLATHSLQDRMMQIMMESMRDKLDDFLND
jgi:hypothetical protein